MDEPVGVAIPASSNRRPVAAELWNTIAARFNPLSVRCASRRNHHGRRSFRGSRSERKASRS